MAAAANPRPPDCFARFAALEEAGINGRQRASWEALWSVRPNVRPGRHRRARGQAIPGGYQDHERPTFGMESRRPGEAHRW